MKELCTKCGKKLIKIKDKIYNAIIIKVYCKKCKINFGNYIIKKI